MKKVRALFASPNLYGALLIVLSGGLAAISNALTHSLPSSFSSWEILFFKSTIGCVALLLLFLSKRRLLLCTSIFRFHFLKGILSTIGNVCWLIALLHLSLAQSSALSLTSALFTSIGGWIIFKEEFPWQLWLALAVGALGVYMIIDISNCAFNWYTVFPLLSALCFSASSLMVKKLAKSDSSYTTLFYLLFFMSLFSFLPMLWEWVTPNMWDIIKLLSIGGLYFITQLFLIEAYSVAAATFIAPFKFARFPLNILAGIFFFFEWPHLMTLIGGILIMGAYYALIRYDRRQKRMARR